MRISSKKQKPDVDLLVRVGVLEKLVDKLVDKVDLLTINVRSSDSTVKEVLEIVAKVQNQTSDDGWDTPPLTEEPKEKKEKGSHQQDEVNQMIYS